MTTETVGAEWEVRILRNRRRMHLQLRELAPRRDHALPHCSTFRINEHLPALNIVVLLPAFHLRYFMTNCRRSTQSTAHDYPSQLAALPSQQVTEAPAIEALSVLMCRFLGQLFLRCGLTPLSPPPTSSRPRVFSCGRPLANNVPSRRSRMHDRFSPTASGLTVSNRLPAPLPP